MERHVDGEQHLLAEGSRQEDPRGINLHLDRFGTDAFVEFDAGYQPPAPPESVAGVDDPELRERILDVVGRAVHE